MSLLTIASACLASNLVAMPTTSAARAGDSSLEFQVIGTRHIGTWIGSGVYSTDFPGVAKKGEKFTTTSTCIWTAGRSAILSKALRGTKERRMALNLSIGNR